MKSKRIGARRWKKISMAAHFHYYPPSSSSFCLVASSADNWQQSPTSPKQRKELPDPCFVKLGLSSYARNTAISAGDKLFSVNVSLTCGIIYRTTLSVLTVLVLLNGALKVKILSCFYNVTSLAHSYIVITVFLGLVSGLFSAHSGAF